MLTYIPVGGTGAKNRKNSWILKGSLFDRFMTEHLFIRLVTEFGFWSTALAGTFFAGRNFLAWEFGGQQLYSFLRDLPYSRRRVIAHSHGGSVVAFMLAMQPAIPLKSLITVDCPVPRKMDKVWKASTNVGVHVHFYGTGWGSRMRWLGQKGRPQRSMPWADHNLKMADHSSILRKPKHMVQMEKALALIAAA